MLHLLVLAALASEGETDASEPEASETDVDEVVVVEARVSDLAHRVLDSAEVRASSARTVAELLEEDVSFSASTGGRGERLFVLRGFDQRQVAVFVDGVPSTIPYDGALDMGKLPSSMVDSVTITTGPSAGIYGPDSLGGTVQLRTRPAPQALEQEARVAGALHGAGEAVASVGGPVGPLRVRLGGGVRYSPGFPLPASFEPQPREDGGLRDASDSRSQDLHGRADLDLGRAGAVEAGVHLMQGSFSVPTGLEGPRPLYWRWSSFRDLTASLRHHTPASSRVQAREVVWVGANSNTLDSYDDPGRTLQEDESSWHSTYRDHRIGGAASVGTTVADRVALGAWVFVDHQSHRKQADTGEDWEHVASTLASGALSAETRSGTWFDGFAGVELDGEVPGNGSDFTPTPLFLGPSMGVRAEPWTWLETSLGVARRARSPTLKERFSESMGYRLPNLDLGPETAWHLGWDLRLHPARWAVVGLSLYDAEVDDLIQDVPVGEGVNQLQNVGRARLAGVELVARLEAPDGLSSRLAASRLHAQKKDVEHPDHRIEERPAWQVVWTEELVVGRASVRSTLKVVGPQWFQDEDTLNWGRLGTYAVWDAWVAWEPGDWSTVRLRASNLLDARYQTRIGYPDPGRQVWAELEVRR